MKFSAQQIADYLSGEVVGNPNVFVNNFSKIEEGQPGTLTFLSNPKYTPFIYTTKADIVLVDATFEAEAPISATLIKVESAYQALAKLLQLSESLKPKKNGIHTLAFIDETAHLGKDVYVGAFVSIGKNVCIGDNTRIYASVVMEDGASVGNNSILYPHVTLYENCKVGNNCIIHAGAVIGADGFGFAPDNEGHYNKIPQIGNVVIEDDVEIGANTTIDRATMESTIIRRGTKIDNLVQIAHNVEIGEYSGMAAQTGIAGSTKIGKHCILAGQVGIAGHLDIADGSIFLAQTGVPNSIKQPNQMWQGYPAVPVATFRRSSVVYKNLSDLQRKIYALEKQINQLTATK
ncbi:MAG: UDP-3-O-(3-hydroxymyristoyl)glucosamine N-acyltransferase [Sphingobacteriia bacterium]|jgi:UDP-3-O-[3-hydroxymyristoyl] glucosamine N-acyltransferase|nr:UDP-3-O-(3-hydroxymyristoyl)glucosamine N-acyltransferase [Paludibacteraceae bacterium]NCA79566.1 UDP-3-O-(3-hydroxymyristoyl)glucosamine N-acyltransferase [Sphingobacteriia bacterium]